MAKRVGLYFDEKTIRAIMKSPKLVTMEQDIMMKKLDEIKAEFWRDFGVSGNFKIYQVDTNSHRSRSTYRIHAADKRTGAILKAHPKWLGKFV